MVRVLTSTALASSAAPAACGALAARASMMRWWRSTRATARWGFGRPEREGVKPGMADNGFSGTERTVRVMTATAEVITLRTRLRELTLTPFTAELARPMQEAILASGDQLSRWMTWWHEGSTEAEALAWAE